MCLFPTCGYINPLLVEVEGLFSGLGPLAGNIGVGVGRNLEGGRAHVAGGKESGVEIESEWTERNCTKARVEEALREPTVSVSHPCAMIPAQGWGTPALPAHRK